MKQFGDKHVTVWLQVFDSVWCFCMKHLGALSTLAQILLHVPASATLALNIVKGAMLRSGDLGGIRHLNPPELGLIGILLHILCHLQQHLQGGSSGLTARTATPRAAFFWPKKKTSRSILTHLCLILGKLCKSNLTAEWYSQVLRDWKSVSPSERQKRHGIKKASKRHRNIMNYHEISKKNSRSVPSTLLKIHLVQQGEQLREEPGLGGAVQWLSHPISKVNKKAADGAEGIHRCTL